MTCIKDENNDQKRKFQKPAGWDTVRCLSATYPDWSEPACRCLGDAGITADQANEILDNVCRQDGIRAVFNSMVSYVMHRTRGQLIIADHFQVVPFKRRCGVFSLTNITEANRCYCTEGADKGTGGRGSS